MAEQQPVKQGLQQMVAPQSAQFNHKFLSPVHERPSPGLGSPNDNERTPDGFYTQRAANQAFVSPFRSPPPDYADGLGYSTEYGAMA